MQHYTRISTVRAAKVTRVVEPACLVHYEDGGETKALRFSFAAVEPSEGDYVVSGPKGLEIVPKSTFEREHRAAKK